MRIAIVGSGVSGLVAAWALQRNHEVTVFEASDWIGGHTHTVDVDLDGDRLAVDTGFIIYNECTYPLFSSLLARLGVESQPTGRRGGSLFHASLVLHRRPIRTLSLAGVLLRYPWMTAQVIAGIYWEAQRLRRKGVPVLPHPRERARALEAGTS